MELKTAVVVLACALSIVEGCTETRSYTVTSTCYKASIELTEMCYLRMALDECNRYIRTSYSCQLTRYHMVCCDDWEGPDCTVPVCFGSTGCPNGGTCESPNQCSCPVGYSSPQCSDIDECASDNGGCEQTCTNIPGSFECSCNTGYNLNPDRKTCSDVNECFFNNGGCQQNCENLPVSFRCACNDGYTLNTDGTTCKDIDECGQTSHNCQQSCVNTVGSYTCGCTNGYILALDEKACEDEDECSSIQDCEHNCDNTVGSYTCSCNEGYNLLADQKRCSDIDECSDNNGNCQHTCMNIPGYYSCTCRAGFTLNADQHACNDIDECQTGTAGCSHGCVNTIGSFQCDCPQGYDLRSDGRTCQDIDDCIDVECENEGMCIDGLMAATCFCQEGFEGPFCESDINECSLLNGGCQDTCTNIDGSFQCSCNGNRTLSSNGRSCEGSSPDDTVFRRHNILGQGLPQGCWTIELAKCTDEQNLKLIMSSTSEWFLLDLTDNVIFTYGIVFVELNQIAVPVSLNGVEVHQTSGNFQLRLGVRDDYSGRGSITGRLRTDNCLNFMFTDGDKFEFIEAGSFLNSLFVSVLSYLPNLIQFDNAITNVIRVQDLKTDLVYGSAIQNDNECKGAPVFPGNLYTIFKFGSPFKIEIYGDTVNVPGILSNERFCLIIDICQSHGSTVFLMLPKESRGLLSKISYIKTLSETHHIYFEPRGIGISFTNGINVHQQRTEVTAWDGNEIYSYPTMEKANFWIGGDIAYNKQDAVLSAGGQGDMFLSVPSIERILTAVFLDEWTGLITMRAMTTATLRFKLFKKWYSIDFTDIVTGELDIYTSIGGTEQRILCGAEANPSGIFLSTILQVNPFKNIPILRDSIFDFNNKVYAFFLTSTATRIDQVDVIDIVNDIIDLKGVFNDIQTFLSDTIDEIKAFISSEMMLIIHNIVTVTEDIIDTINKNLPRIQTGNLANLVDYITELSNEIREFTETVRFFLESAELFVNDVTDKVTLFVKTELQAVKDNFKRITQRLQQQMTNLVGDYDGFGLKYHATITIFGLQFPELDVEFVYSTSRLFACSRFDSINELLAGKPAARFLMRASYEKQLGHFLTLKSVGFGMALAIDSGDVIVQLQVFAHLLGAKVTADVFITNKQLTLYTELNVWNIFLAQLDVKAELGKKWYDLTLQVRGRFVVTDKKKRQVQSGQKSFQRSYLDALKKVVRQIADVAQMRLNQAQQAITNVQSSLTVAQRWLEEKKADVRNAHRAFDAAVEWLQRVEQKLEDAKEPYRNAIRKLEATQRNVDNLCRIRTCRMICIPGVKCRMCSKKVWGLRIRYPCCGFTRCMFSIPNPLCVLANLLCRAARALAYLALEVAKIFVRVLMITYDVAKLVVSVAQVIVDKSRVLLDLAEGALTFAQAGLEGVKGLLEVTKVALEAVKVVIGVAVKVLEFVIEYGLQNLLDVRNCEFNIDLSIHSLPVFQVSCEVNAFKLGWKKVSIGVNFQNILQSIWQAAKATIRCILDTFDKIFKGRKRREILYRSTSTVHTFLRLIRSTNLQDTNSTTQTVDEFIDTLYYTQGFDNGTSSDYDNRVRLFAQKCVDISNVIAFLNETFSTLFDIANETHAGIMDALFAKDQLLQYNVTEIANNMTLESAGVDAGYAMQDYNISEAELEQILNTSKSQAQADPMLTEINDMVGVSSESIDSEVSAAESVQILNQWLVAMENTTNEYFSDDKCFRFRDCVFHAIGLLYDLYTNENLPNIDVIQDAIATLEDTILDVLQNTTSSISDTFNASSSIMADIQLLSDTNLFCSKAPEFTIQMKNVTTTEGSTATIRCHVTADPTPDFWWFRDGVYIYEATTDTVTLENVTSEHAAVYQCTAGNVVANVTSDEIYVIVRRNGFPLGQDIDQTIEAYFPVHLHVAATDEEDFPTTTVAIVTGIVTGIGLLVTIAAVACYLTWSRKKVDGVDYVPEEPTVTQVDDDFVVYAVPDDKINMPPADTSFFNLEK